MARKTSGFAGCQKSKLRVADEETIGKAAGYVLTYFRRIRWQGSGDLQRRAGKAGDGKVTPPDREVMRLDSAKQFFAKSPEHFAPLIVRFQIRRFKLCLGI